MASHSGIRASGSGTGEYVKRIVLKDAASYGPWRAKLTSILDAEECWEIVNGTELEPDEIATVEDHSDEELPYNIPKVLLVRLKSKTGKNDQRKTRHVDAIVTSTQLNSLHLSNTQLKLRTQLLLRLRSTQTQTQTHSHTH